MSQRSWYVIEFAEESHNKKMSFFALNAEDAVRQFRDWWDFRTDRLSENLPVPAHWFSSDWSIVDTSI